jgi:acyl carrier protein
MKTETLEAELIALMGERIPTEVPFGPDTDLVADTAMDSVELLELIAELEDRYGVSLDEEALQSVLTAGDLVRVILVRVEA